MRKFFLGQLWSIFYDVVVFRHPPSCAVFFFFLAKIFNKCVWSCSMKQTRVQDFIEKINRELIKG